MLIRIPAKRTYATSRGLPCHFKEIHGHLNCRYDGRGSRYPRARLLEVTAVSLFFPFLAGWLCEILWGKLQV